MTPPLLHRNPNFIPQPLGRNIDPAGLRGYYCDLRHKARHALRALPGDGLEREEYWVIPIAQAAFAKGAESLGRIARTEIPWLPPTECDLTHLDSALDRFAQSVSQIKKNVLNACIDTVSFDGEIAPREAEIRN